MTIAFHFISHVSFCRYPHFLICSLLPFTFWHPTAFTVFISGLSTAGGKNEDVFSLCLLGANVANTMHSHWHQNRFSLAVSASTVQNYYRRGNEECTFYSTTKRHGLFLEITHNRTHKCLFIIEYQHGH